VYVAAAFTRGLDCGAPVEECGLSDGGKVRFEVYNVASSNA